MVARPSYTEWIGRVFVDGLSRPVVQEYIRHYEGHANAYAEIKKILEKNSPFRMPWTASMSVEALVEALDVQALIRLMKARWPEIFEDIIHDDALLADVANLRIGVGHNFVMGSFDAAQYAEITADLLEAFGVDYETAELRQVASQLREECASFSEEIRQANTSIRQATEEQLTIIQTIESKTELGIAGCAGSGKTIIAAEMAIRFSGAGLSTLLLCQSPRLSMYLKELVAGTPVKVFTLNEWIQYLLGRQLSESYTDWNPYSFPSIDNLNAALQKLELAGTLRFDTVIVDEGQDFIDEWWIIVRESLSTAEHSRLYVFFDDNQRLIHVVSDHVAREMPILKLKRNCRNALRIHDLVSHLHPELPESGVRVSGRCKLHLYDRNFEDPIAVVKQVLLSIDDRRNAIVLSTEEGPAELSIANHLLLELPAIPGHSPVSWQFAVVNRMERAGLKHPVQLWEQLSSEAVPTASDLLVIEKEANALNSKKPRPTDGMHLRTLLQSGRLWRGTGPASKLDIVSDRLAMQFLSTTKWEETLPNKVTPSVFQLKALENLFAVPDFKGLEADSIVLFAPSEHPLIVQQLYIGASRAKASLDLVVESRVWRSVSVAANVTQRLLALEE